MRDTATTSHALAERLAQATEVPVHVVDDPLECVVRGAGLCLDSFDSLRPIFAAAAMGGVFLPGEWYANLKKPSWNPSGWLFGPVWSALYLCMAVAAWLVARARFRFTWSSRSRTTANR